MRTDGRFARRCALSFLPTVDLARRAVQIDGQRVNGAALADDPGTYYADRKPIFRMLANQDNYCWVEESMIRRTIAQTKVSTFCVQLPNPELEGMPTPVGTGFFVSSDGWFVTAAHVVKGKDGTVRNDISNAWLMKESRPGHFGAMCQGVSLDYIDQQSDIALLQVDFAINKDKEWLKGKNSFPFIEVSRRQLEEGEPVYSFGYPLSNAHIKNFDGMIVGEEFLSPRITSAIVSSTLENTKMVMSSGDEKIYVLDKALNYGNSGGPIVAVETGKVHALCSRFQPVMVPQKHLPDSGGKPMFIMTPSLYGIVLAMHNPSILKAFSDRSIPTAAE